MQTVLGTSNALKVFIVQPVDMSMGVPGVMRTSVDISSVYVPQVRDHVDVVFRNIRSNVGVQKFGMQPGKHYESPRLLSNHPNAIMPPDMLEYDYSRDIMWRIPELNLPQRVNIPFSSTYVATLLKRH